MSKSRGLIVAVVVIAAAIGLYAMRGGKFPPDGMQGSIGAAKRYQAEQISADQVKLDNPEVQSFLQSDVFHKIQTNAEFRKMVTDADFVAALKSGDLQRVAADPDGRAAIKSKGLERVAGSPELSAAFQDPGLRRAVAEHGTDLGLIIGDKKSLGLLSSPQFERVAKEKGIDALAATSSELAAIFSGKGGLELVKKLDAEKVKNVADVEQVIKGYSLITKSPEYGRANDHGDLVQLLASPDFRRMILDGSLLSLAANPAYEKVLASDSRLVFNSPIFRLAASHPEVALAVTDKELQLALQKPEVESAIGKPAILSLMTKADFQALAGTSDFWLAAADKRLGLIAGRDDFARVVSGNLE